MKITRYIVLLQFSLITSFAWSQIQLGDKVSLSGSLQADVLFPQEDEAIGTGTYDDWGLTNTYLDLNLLSKYVSAGARLEYLDHLLFRSTKTNKPK